MVRRRLALYQRWDGRAALVATCLRVAPVGSPRLDLVGTILIHRDVPLTASLKVG